MKIWIVSDLHCDHYPWIPNRVPTHDVMIIAGDVGDGALDAIGELQRIRRRSQRKIIFVPGNHDYFGDGLDRFDDVKVAGVHVLSSGQSVVIDGVRFVGATLWTDFGITGHIYRSEAWAARHMPDYQHIRRNDGCPLWPADTSDAHVLHLARIEAVLSQPHAGPTIVVTHHAPSPQSCRQPLGDSDGAFASDLEDLILRTSPRLWVHGHIHAHRDYLVSSTRILANPRGYEGADWSEKSGFIEDFVVEV